MIIDIQRYWGEREIYFPGELSSKIIQSMQTDGSVILRSKESRSIKLSGLEFLLVQLCEYWKWDYEQITIETGNVYDIFFNEYKFIVKKTFMAESAFDLDLNKIEHRAWNKEKTYGMFIGRANVTRLHAVHRHKNFDFRDQGLTSFNHDLSQYVDPQYLLEYLTQTDKRMSEVINIKPYSDISPVQTPPITMQYSGPVWNDVYEKIGIEIVLETAEDNGTHALTEKLLRPILYKRPFILIAGQNVINDIWKQMEKFDKNTTYDTAHNLEFFKNYDSTQTFKFFENVIPLEYDRDGGIHRVDHAFDILHTLIRTGKINSIIEDCQDDIEHNYQFAVRNIQLSKSYKQEYKNLFDRASWSKPTY